MSECVCVAFEKSVCRVITLVLCEEEENSATDGLESQVDIPRDPLDSPLDLLALSGFYATSWQQFSSPREPRGDITAVAIIPYPVLFLCATVADCSLVLIDDYVVGNQPSFRDLVE